MRLPLSMSFYKLISRTADAGKEKERKPAAPSRPNTRLPEPGLLTPDRPYYWHVRAKNAQGVWGPWSKTWSFTAARPGLSRWT